MKKLEKHCCDQMTRYLDDQRINVHYLPKYREYDIYLENSPAKQGLVFCPWCGKKLPDGLRDEYFDILEQEYNIAADIFTKEVPEEFKTDEWWKKRKL